MSIDNLDTLVSAIPGYGPMNMTTAQLQQAITAMNGRGNQSSAPQQAATTPAAIQDFSSFIPGAICNRTLEQLTESMQRPATTGRPIKGDNRYRKAQHYRTRVQQYTANIKNIVSIYLLHDTRD